MNKAHLTVKIFTTPLYPYGNDHYYHEMVAVAEGFRELGYRVIGNADYWWEPEKQAYLIPGDLNNPDFDIAIYDYRYVASFAHLLFRKGYPNFDRSKIHVLIDRNDWLQPLWWKNPNYDVFDLILAGNLFKDFTYAGNVRPWAIGLTNRMIGTIDRFYDVETKREEIAGYNFRVDHNMRGYLLNVLKQQLRAYPAVSRITAGQSKSEADRHYQQSTTGRHDPGYYSMLCKTRFFMTFGGYYEFLPKRYLPYTLSDKLLRKPAYWKYLALKKRKKDFSSQIFIFQHDNFRFWEVLYSGCIAINLDLDHWGFRLPVMPEAGRHYIGIKQLHSDVDSQLSTLDENRLREISQSARDWVRNNYSPSAQANRILHWLDERAK